MASGDAAVLRARIVTEARTLLGTPFRHQGRLPGRGLDCVGVVVTVGKRLGLIDYDRLGYGHFPAGELLAGHAAAAGFRVIDAARAAPGDVLLFRFDGQPRHVALLTDRGILHAFADARRVVEHDLDPVWRGRLAGAYAFASLFAGD